jgi:hypothetical protein
LISLIVLDLLFLMLLTFLVNSLESFFHLVVSWQYLQQSVYLVIQIFSFGITETRASIVIKIFVKVFLNLIKYSSELIKDDLDEYLAVYFESLVLKGVLELIAEILHFFVCEEDLILGSIEKDQG